MIERAVGRFTAVDGLELAFEEWRGDAPSMLFVHANGFCKEVWRPVVAELGARWAASSGLAMDLRGHGDSQAPPLPIQWRQLGADAAAAAQLIDLPRIGVGHSVGATALCRAEAAAPGLFAALVLVEPIIPAPPYRRNDDATIVKVTRRRRSSFASREAARSNFAEKSMFRGWASDALDEYVSHGFIEREGRWELKCSPKTEADIFAEGWNSDTRDLLPLVKCPVVIVAGSDSETHPAHAVDDLAARFEDARVVVVAGASHFVPMERPEAVAAAVADLADTIQS